MSIIPPSPLMTQSALLASLLDSSSLSQSLADADADSPSISSLVHHYSQVFQCQRTVTTSGPMTAQSRPRDPMEWLTNLLSMACLTVSEQIDTVSDEDAEQLLRMLDLLHEQVKAAPPTPAVTILPPLHSRTATAQTVPVSRTTSLLSQADDGNGSISMRNLSDLTPAHAPFLQQPANHAGVASHPASAPTSPVQQSAFPAAHRGAVQNTAAAAASALHTAAIEKRIAELEHSLATLRLQNEADRTSRQHQLTRLSQQHDDQLRTTAAQRRQAERQYEDEIAELVRRIQSDEDDRQRQELADKAERDERTAELTRLQDEVAVHKRREAEWMSERGSRDDVLRGMVEERERKIGETIRYYDERMQRWKEVVRSIKEEMRDKVERTHAMMAQLKAQLAEEKERCVTLTQQVQSQQHSHKLQVAELEREVLRLRDERDEAAQKLKHTEEQREREVAALQSQVADLHETTAALRAQWHAREVEVTTVLTQWSQRWEQREQSTAHDVYRLAYDADEHSRTQHSQLAQAQHAAQRLQQRVEALEAEVAERVEAFGLWVARQGGEGREEVGRLRRDKEAEERRRREVEGVVWGLERELAVRREEAVRVSGLEQQVLKLGMRVREGEMSGGIGGVGMVVGVVVLCQLMGSALYVFGGDVLPDRWLRGLQGWL